MSYPLTGWVPSRVLNAVPTPGSTNSYEVRGNGLQTNYVPSGYSPEDQAAAIERALAGTANDPTGNDFSTYSSYDPIVLPPEYWPSQEQYDRTAAQMQQFGITPPPRGTLDPTATSALGTALYNQPSWQDSPFVPAAVAMGPAIAAAFGAGGGAGTVATTTGTGSATVTGAPIVSAGTAAPAAGAAGVGGMGSIGANGAGVLSPAATGAAAGSTLMTHLPTILSGAASLLGGKMASNAAEDAVDAQVQSGREALDYQRESRDLALGIARPQLQSGNVALARMLQMTGQPIPAALQQALTEAGVTDLGEFDIKDDPSYQFRLDESMRALENSAFARGNGMSGGFARSAIRYAQDYASTEYSNIYARLATVAGYGPVAANSSSNTALNYGANASNIAVGSGDARASGYVAQSNAWQNALDQIAKLPWDQWFKRQQPVAAGA